MLKTHLTVNFVHNKYFQTAKIFHKNLDLQNPEGDEESMSKALVLKVELHTIKTCRDDFASKKV